MAKHRKHQENRPSATSWTSPPDQQMDRSEDPEERAEEDSDAAETAMEAGEGHDAQAGSADDVGSMGYDEEGAFDVTGASENAKRRHPEVGDKARRPPYE